MSNIITAAYTICKNEVDNIDRWLYYTSFYDYRVLLDTGSDDGTWEKLQECAKKDKNLIIEQKIFDPWHFSNARNYNLTMVPTEVDWCLTPDLDEFYTKNTLDELKECLKVHPTLTNLACDRFDIYSYTPRVGPPNYIPSNKIHKRHDYIWVQPIYEHLRFKYPIGENELYSSDIYIVHDQDFNKKERTSLYVSMLENEYETNPKNTWCLWYLVYYYWKSNNLSKFVKAGYDYIQFHNDVNDKNYKSTLTELSNILIHKPKEATESDLTKIENLFNNIRK